MSKIINKINLTEDEITYLESILRHPASKVRAFAMMDKLVLSLADSQEDISIFRNWMMKWFTEVRPISDCIWLKKKLCWWKEERKGMGL